MLNTAEFCDHLMRLLHTPIRQYDKTGKCVAVFQDRGEQQDPLKQDQVFLTQLLELANLNCPAIYQELDGALYGIMATPEDGIFILGPSSLHRDSRELAKAVAARHGLDRSIPYCISPTLFDTFCHGVSALFHHCTGQKLSWDQIALTNFQTEHQNRLLQEKVNQVCYAFQEQGKVHNPYSQERREQESIRRGDVEGLNRSFRETYVGEVGTVARNPVRQARNIAIVLVTLSTRSAIEGGVPPEMAFSISDAFIQRVEEMDQPPEIYAAARQMEVQLAQMVCGHQKNQGQSAMVIRCKEEILPRLHQKITVKELAQVLDVTPDYLSHVFAQEEGVTISEYIGREKVRYAQWRLIYSRDSYEAIAYAYGFSSQSHFGKVFKKWTGMTPKQYREQHQNGVNR